MVVWQDGDMKKDEYKRFKIRTVTGTDDFASMQEVVTRRYGRALESLGVLPDLILLDGGRGQLGAGMKALEDLGLDYIPLAALAKRAEEVYTPDRLQPLVLDLGSPALQALQRIRDEAHRFAITYGSCVSAGPSPPCWTRSRGGADLARPAQDPGLAKECGRPRWPTWPRCRRSPRSWRSASMLSSIPPPRGNLRKGRGV
jgi:hypothetical protein